MPENLRISIWHFFFCFTIRCLSLSCIFYSHFVFSEMHFWYLSIPSLDHSEFLIYMIPDIDILWRILRLKMGFLFIAKVWLFSMLAFLRWLFDVRNVCIDELTLMLCYFKALCLWIMKFLFWRETRIEHDLLMMENYFFKGMKNIFNLKNKTN